MYRFFLKFDWLLHMTFIMSHDLVDVHVVNIKEILQLFQCASSYKHSVRNV